MFRKSDTNIFLTFKKEDLIEIGQGGHMKKILIHNLIIIRLNCLDVDMLHTSTKFLLKVFNFLAEQEEGGDVRGENPK